MHGPVPGVKGRAWLAGLGLPLEERESVEGGGPSRRLPRRWLAAVERLIAQRALEWSEIRRLMTVPGVNLICAASFIAAVGDVSRFFTSRKLVAYLGLDPKVRQSGEAPARSGRISKRGSASARWALVEAACRPARCTPSMSAHAHAAGTARRSSPPPASWPCCSGACSSAARTTPTSNRR